MAILPIITAPDPRLTRKSKPVARVDADIRKLMGDMLETMHLAPGIGLAAPQIGVLKRVIVLDIAGENEARNPMCLANPELVWVSDEDAVYSEGCLSVPDHYADVTRPAACRVTYRDENDVIREISAEGLLSTCLQHEIDHLDGILFIDHLTALKRNIILRKLLKNKKQGKTEAPA
jgi:peptide deformylase